MARRPAATVVGGGIAGLASAVSLAQAGWRTTVLERASGFGEVGAGVALPRNGMAALRALGLDDDAVQGLGHETVGTGFRDSRGRWLLRIPVDRADVRRTATVVGVHRRRLHAALLDSAEAEGVELVTGAEVHAVRTGAADGARAAVTWRTGGGRDAGTDAGGHETTAEADLVVGADGMWSAVRRELYPEARPRYSGSTSWRAIVRDSERDGRLHELWGPGAEFGTLRIGPDDLYWYGYVRHGEGASFPDERTAALARFADFAPGVGALIEATEPDRLMRHDVYHLPGGVPRFARGRVVMVGDAAHAALPTMGQGAATALEDGVCLGRLVGAPVAAGGSLRAALVAFDGARRPRTRAIARQAVLMARFGADLGGGWRQVVRNTLLRSVPGGAVAGAGTSIVDWTPPPVAGAASR